MNIEKVEKLAANLLGKEEHVIHIIYNILLYTFYTNLTKKHG